MNARGRPDRPAPAHGRRDARLDHRGRASRHRPGRPRAEHGVHLRARRPRPHDRTVRSGTSRPLPLPVLKRNLDDVAGRARCRRRLELALLEQPRPATGGVAVRRRLPRAPGQLGQDTRHRVASAQGHAVRLPGRRAGDDQHLLRRHQRLPRHRVDQLPRRGAQPRHGSRVGAWRRSQLKQPGQRPDPDAVGRLPARRIHRRCAVAAGQPPTT